MTLNWLTCLTCLSGKPKTNIGASYTEHSWVQIERDGGIFRRLPPPQCYTARLSLRIARLALGSFFDITDKGVLLVTGGSPISLSLVFMNYSAALVAKISYLTRAINSSNSCYGHVYVGLRANPLGKEPSNGAPTPWKGHLVQLYSLTKLVPFASFPPLPYWLRLRWCQQKGQEVLTWIDVWIFAQYLNLRSLGFVVHLLKPTKPTRPSYSLPPYLNEGK